MMGYRSLLVNDRKIRFLDTGEGPALVLVHGFLESSGIWSDFIRHLSGPFRVIAPDLPGHGGSETVPGLMGMDGMAEAIFNVLRFTGTKKCVMIGHSMGGYVTMAFAEKHPDLLAGFGLFHSTARADTPEVKQNRIRTIEAIRNDHLSFVRQFIPALFAPVNRGCLDEEIKRMVQQAGRMKKEAIIDAIIGMKDRPDRLHLIGQSTVPVLFISGREDPRVNMQDMAQQALTAFRGQLNVLGGVGHMGYLEAMNETAAIISAFAGNAFILQNEKTARR
ncbi:MAG: alpha/beta hydrolase [Bacteroidales bacterium]|nr:alpha/beta hydrolase [Bacteroidales bacterium]